LFKPFELNLAHLGLVLGIGNFDNDRDDDLYSYIKIPENTPNIF